MSFPRKLVALALLLAAGCAPIPAGRFGVASVRFRGVQQVDAESIRACLGTRERPRLTIDVGTRGTPLCSQPPFDGRHAIIEPLLGVRFSWPYTQWPLFDESVFERDMDRIQRWYRARGYYEAEVEGTVSPESAVQNGARRDDCGDERGDCTVDVTFVVDEGEPVTISRMSLRGLDELPSDMRQRLRRELPFTRGDPFDETLYEQTKSQMVRVLASNGYARASVAGEVKVNAGRREVYLTYTIASGQPSVVGEICVVGYGSLPAQRMLDVAALEPGVAFSLEELAEAQRALYSVGTFSGVEVGPLFAPYAEGENPVCLDGPAEVPQGHEAVDIRIRVTPGRIDRWNFGVGFQAGQAVTFGTVTTFADQQAAAQWDIHASAAYEGRNWFDNLVRTRLEVRPRLIFNMPVFNFSSARDPPLGITVSGSMRWPAWLEPRTNLLLQIQEELGPMPFTGFFRNELGGLVGPERSFLDGRLYGGIFVRASWFLATDRQPEAISDALPSSGSLWFEQVIRLDLRDNPRQPHEGAFFALSAQQGFQPLSTWDFTRFVAEARGYVPLPFGVVLAGRFRYGMMNIIAVDRNTIPEGNVYQQDGIGPPALQLVGGGASSHRGFLPGLLGDAQQVYVSLPRTVDEIRRGIPPRSRPVRITGGNTLWEASIELRVPVTTAIGVVLFADAGDVDRWAGRAEAPRFDHPQVAFGFGLRYQTIIGPLRLDIGLRPDELQVFANQDQRAPVCVGDTSASGVTCRPDPSLPFLFGAPGALHLTIGEAF